jgi:hypothetical protein
MSSLMVLSAKPEQILELDGIVKECNLSNMTAEQAFESAFRMAAGVQKLRQTITPAMMKDIMALQGTALGFRTDKDRDGGYDVEVVKDCAIEAVLRGFRLVGNEINIIAGRMYGTKEGFARLVREFEGITDLRLVPGVPRLQSGGALVTYRANWKFEGAPQNLEREFAIRVNSGMGADAIVGKATRKMLAAIYGQLTGSEHALPEGEVGDEVLTPEKTAVSTLNESLPTPTKESPTVPVSDLAAEADIAFLDAEGISDVEAIRASLAKKATSPADSQMLLDKANAKVEELRAKKRK